LEGKNNSGATSNIESGEEILWPKLEVRNKPGMELPGLGRNKKFSELSEKRITKCVREALHASFPGKKIEVSCSAHFDKVKGEWKGECEIDAQFYPYIIVFLS